MDYNLEIEASSNVSELNIEDMDDMKADLGEIEEVVSDYDVEIDSIDIGRINDRETFIISLEDSQVMASPEMIRLVKSGDKNELPRFGGLIEDIARLYREKQEEIEFKGSLDISGEKNLDAERVFERLTSPLDNWNEGIAASFTHTSEDSENPDMKISLFRSGDSTRLLVSSNIVAVEENPNEDDQRFLSEMIREQIEVWKDSFEKLEEAIND